MDDQNPDLVAAAPENKGLLRVVYIMGIILVVLFFALVAGIIYKSQHRAAVANAPGVVELGLPAGTIVRETSLTGDKLTLNTGAEVIVIELSTHKVLLRVKVANP
jgi:hypothetical protein